MSGKCERFSMTGNVSLNSLRTLTKCASFSCLKFLCHLWNQFEKRFFLIFHQVNRFPKCLSVCLFVEKVKSVTWSNGADTK